MKWRIRSPFFHIIKAKTYRPCSSWCSPDCECSGDRTKVLSFCYVEQLQSLGLNFSLLIKLEEELAPLQTYDSKIPSVQGAGSSLGIYVQSYWILVHWTYRKWTMEDRHTYYFFKFPLIFSSKIFSAGWKCVLSGHCLCVIETGSMTWVFVLESEIGC